jgi:hypothetical protein
MSAQNVAEVIADRDAEIERLKSDRDSYLRELQAVRAEVERLKLLAYSNLGDNHHNANDCPYCKAALEPKP